MVKARKQGGILKAVQSLYTKEQYVVKIYDNVTPFDIHLGVNRYIR